MTPKEKLIGLKWWEEKNPAYRKSCFNQASRDLIKMNTEFNAIITHKQKK